MSDLADGIEPRLRQQLLPDLGVCQRLNAIVLAPNEHRRRADAVQPLGELTVACGVFEGETWRCRRLAMALGPAVEIMARRHEGGEDRLITHQITRQAGRWHREQVERWQLVDHQSTGGDEHEPVESVLLGDRQLRGEPSTERGADEIKTPDLQRIEEIEIVQDIVVY